MDHSTTSSCCLRSFVERDATAQLDAWNVRWEYEAHIFKLDNGESYTPDLWLPELGVLIEVKGPRSDRWERLHKPTLLARQLDPRNEQHIADGGLTETRGQIPVFVWTTELWCAYDDRLRGTWYRCRYCDRAQPQCEYGYDQCRYCGAMYTIDGWRGHLDAINQHTFGCYGNGCTHEGIWR